jgi:hypothetical protein
MANGTATAPAQAAPPARPVRRLRTEPPATTDGTANRTAGHGNRTAGHGNRTAKKPRDHGNLSAISDL